MLPHAPGLEQYLAEHGSVEVQRISDECYMVLLDGETIARYSVYEKDGEVRSLVFEALQMPGYHNEMSKEGVTTLWKFRRNGKLVRLDEHFDLPF